MTFFEAAAFQWVNPKAWAMALTAITLYAPTRSFAAIVLVAAVFGAVNLPSVSAWAATGRGLRRLLDRPARLRAFNWTMALLLLVSTLPML
jgi:threonine/homoserine/homoserine lactone efflux protein